MIDGVLLDKLVIITFRLLVTGPVLSEAFQDAIGRAIRGRDPPFGGLQVSFHHTLLAYSTIFLACRCIPLSE